MNDSTREISPLRQRMLEDMRLRKLAPHRREQHGGDAGQEKARSEAIGK
jgi:hypothetical protein